jgi:hypothetical protein
MSARRKLPPTPRDEWMRETKRTVERTLGDCGLFPSDLRIIIITVGEAQRRALRRDDEGYLITPLPRGASQGLHAWQPAPGHVFPAYPRTDDEAAWARFMLDYLRWQYVDMLSTPWRARQTRTPFPEFVSVKLNRFRLALFDSETPSVDAALETAARFCPWLFTEEGVGAVSYALLEKHL